MQRVVRLAPLNDTVIVPLGTWESLCLVGTFHRYMEVTKPHRYGSCQLVVPSKEGTQGKEVSKLAIA